MTIPIEFTGNFALSGPVGLWFSAALAGWEL